MSSLPSHASIAYDVFCPHCGYNLRALTGDNCPECGRSVGDVRSAVSQIPWARRKEIGWFRAYCKTLWFVMFRGKHFVNEMAREVSYAYSQKFRWLTIFFAYLPILISNVILWIPRTTSPTTNELVNFFWVRPERVALLHVAFVMFLIAATGIPSYFFHPRWMSVERQNKAICLSYYMCAPLALMWIPTGGAMLWFYCETSILPSLLFGEPASITLLIATLAFMVGLPLIYLKWWIDLIRLARRIMPERPQRAVGVALLVPLFDLFAGALVLLFFPGAVLFIWLIILSLL